MSEECEHGQLRRQCPLCERDQRIAELEKRAERLAEVADKWMNRYLNAQQRAEAARREADSYQRELNRYWEKLQAADERIRTLEAALCDCKEPLWLLSELVQRDEYDDSVRRRGEKAAQLVEQINTLANRIEADSQDDAEEALSDLTELRLAAEDPYNGLTTIETDRMCRSIERNLRTRQHCPHIVTSSEGTQYCALAEQAAKVPDSVPKLIGTDSAHGNSSRERLAYVNGWNACCRALAGQGEGGEG